MSNVEYKEEDLYLVIEFSKENAQLDFQTLFEKGITGKFKIKLEKVDD